MPFYTASHLRIALKSSVSFAWASGVSAGLLVALPLVASPALANPLSATVTTGSASIAASSSKTQIDQKSEDVVIDWSSFNIGAGQTTQFVQPNAQAIAVNRIGGNSASQILGTLDANGRIVLINGNGMLFGKGSQVNVGSLIATSTGGPDSDVLAGNFTQAGNRNASIVNRGSIRTAQGGLVALVAPSVTNDGTVNAKFGTIAVGAANKFTVDFSGDGLVSFAAQGDVNGNATAVNTGALTGANISLTAHAAEGVATGVVAMSGIVLAQTATNVGGTITLDAGDGGTVSVSRASLDASGANGGGTIQIGGWSENAVAVDKASILNASATRIGNGGSISVISGNTNFQGSALAQGGASGGNGGTIETSGHNLNFTGATVDAGAAHGRDGSWLLDPYDLKVNNAAATTIDSSLASNTNVTLQTTATGTSGPGIPIRSGHGDIIIDSPIEWSTIATLSLSAYRNIDFNADITVSGGGILAMTTGTGTAGDYIIATGDRISFAGGSSSGASLSINATPYTLLYSMSDMQNINVSSTSLARDYALAIPLNASGTSSWVPIGTNGAGTVGNSGNGFTGVFAGLGNTISNLTIDLPSVSDVGLFGYSSGTIRDIGMVRGSVNGNDNVGSLVGYVNDGFVEDAYATGPVSGSSDVGGLLGEDNNSTITNAHATGAVSGGGEAGGLVGSASGNANHTINNSYATGAVNGTSELGGLVGYCSCVITDAYATGPVTGSNYVGGLIGESVAVGNNVNVSSSYATGAVSGSDYVGGLTGFAGGTLISNSYATGTVSGDSEIGGLVGEIAAEPYGQTTIFSKIDDSFATGTVNGGEQSQYVGGLVGTDSVGNIFGGYATGAVSGGEYVGGLIGWSSAQTIYYAYSSGAVIGETDAGGLIGYNDASRNNEIDGGWDIQTSGQAIGIGHGASSSQLVGATTAELQDGSFFSNDVGYSQPAGLFAYFTWQYPTGTPQAISGVAYKDDGETPLASTSSGIGTVAVLLNGANLGSISTGANGYYYILLAPGTISGSGSAVLAYTAQNSATGATNGAILENATGTLDDFNIWGDTFIAPTSGTTYSSASGTSLQSQDAALIAQAVGSNASAQTLVAGLTNYGYIATGSGFTFDAAVNLSDGLFVQTTAADADITIDDAVKLSDSSKLRLIATGNIDIDNMIKTAGTVSLTAGGTIAESGPGSIAAATLTGSSDGGATLNGANLVGTYANFTNSGAGGISLVDHETLTVAGTVNSGSGNLALATKGAGHNIEITGSLTAGDKIGLNASGGITQSAAGALTAVKLAGSANGAVVLTGTNLIAGIGTFKDTGGDFTLIDGETLIAGTVDAGSHNETLQTTSGDIDVDAALTWSGAGTLTLDAANSIVIAAPLVIAHGGSLDLTTNAGNTGGTLDFADGNIAFTQVVSGVTQGTLTIDTVSYTLANSVKQLAQDIAANATGNYALADSYDASGNGTYGASPIATAFGGVFEGLGNTISNLTIDDTANNANVGLFAMLDSTATIRDFGLVDANVTGGAATGSGVEAIGALVGDNDGGTIALSTVTGGSVTGGASSYVGGLAGLNFGGLVETSNSSASVSGGTGASVGGLVGQNDEDESTETIGTIELSYATGDVTGSSGTAAGGLVGDNDNGAITQSYATGTVTGSGANYIGGLSGENSAGTISQSYASGAVSGGLYVGGLTGFSSGSIENVYATGAVTGGAGEYVGGLIGETDGTVMAAYSSGAVTGNGANDVGGLVGINDGTISDSYWDTTTSGITDTNQGCGSPTNCSGVTGQSTVQLQTSIPTGFSKAIWGESAGINGGLPYLLALPPS